MENLVLSTTISILLVAAAALAAISSTLYWSTAALSNGKGLLALTTDVTASPWRICVTIWAEAIVADPALAFSIPPALLAQLPPGALESLERGGPLSASCVPPTPEALQSLAGLASGGGALSASQAEALSGVLALAQGLLWAGVALATAGGLMLAWAGTSHAPPRAAAAKLCALPTAASYRGTAMFLGSFAATLLSAPVFIWAALHERYFVSSPSGLVGALAPGWFVAGSAPFLCLGAPLVVLLERFSDAWRRHSSAAAERHAHALTPPAQNLASAVRHPYLPEAAVAPQPAAAGVALPPPLPAALTGEERRHHAMLSPDSCEAADAA